MLISICYVIKFPGEDNSIQKSESLLILRHLPQKISKPHFFATEAPEENPHPGKTSLAWHIRLTESVAAIYIIPLSSLWKITGYIYNPVIFPGEDNGIIYIAMEKFET